MPPKRSRSDEDRSDRTPSPMVFRRAGVRKRKPKQPNAGDIAPEGARKDAEQPEERRSKRIRGEPPQETNQDETMKTESEQGQSKQENQKQQDLKEDGHEQETSKQERLSQEKPKPEKPKPGKPKPEKPKQQEPEADEPEPKPEPQKLFLDGLPLEMVQEVAGYLTKEEKNSLRRANKQLDYMIMPLWADEIHVYHDLPSTTAFLHFIREKSQQDAIKRVVIHPGRFPMTWITPSNRYLGCVIDPAKKLEICLRRLSPEVVIDIHHLFQGRWPHEPARNPINPNYQRYKALIELVQIRTLFTLRCHPKGFRSWTIVDKTQGPNTDGDANYVPLNYKMFQFQQRAQGPHQKWRAHRDIYDFLKEQWPHVMKGPSYFPGKNHKELRSLELDLHEDGNDPKDFVHFLTECPQLTRLQLACDDRRRRDSRNTWGAADTLLNKLVNLPQGRQLPQHIRELRLRLTPNPGAYRNLEAFILDVDGPDHSLRELDFWFTVRTNEDFSRIIEILNRLFARGMPTRHSLRLRMDHLDKDLGFCSKIEEIAHGPITHHREWPALKKRLRDWRESQSFLTWTG